MKRMVSLLAVLVICVLGALSVAAAEDNPAALTADSETTVIRAADAVTTTGESSLPDGVVREDELVIDLRTTTAVIIGICGALTIGIIVMVIILIKKNRD